MTKVTEQINTWSGAFGKDYTDRNALSVEELETLYEHRYGISRSRMNNSFLNKVDLSTRILEVGSNIGNQLLCLQQMGFSDLWGIELQDYAVELAKSRTRKVNIIQSSVFDIPYKDCYFDLVFTSGLLIHIHPDDIAEAMREIHRCTKEYIWGFEYYAPEYTEIAYRQHERLLWKTDFARLYLSLFDDLASVKEERYEYLDSDSVDSMFLLRREQR
jgi:pseudaminic acid biosynthesis-associated methylase